jgi:hypothetical protein
MLHMSICIHTRTFHIVFQLLPPLFRQLEVAEA